MKPILFELTDDDESKNSIQGEEVLIIKRWEDATLYFNIRRIDGIIGDIWYSQTGDQVTDSDFHKSLAEHYTCRGFAPDGYLTGIFSTRQEQEDEMTYNHLSDADIEGLYRNGSSSSINKHRELYEILKGKECDIPKDGEGYQMLYSNKLEALISYNYFKTKYKTVLFGDSSDFYGPDTYCIVVDTQAINGNAWMDWSKK